MYNSQEGVALLLLLIGCVKSRAPLRMCSAVRDGRNLANQKQALCPTETQRDVLKQTTGIAGMSTLLIFVSHHYWPNWGWKRHGYMSKKCHHYEQAFALFKYNSSTLKASLTFQFAQAIKNPFNLISFTQAVMCPVCRVQPPKMRPTLRMADTTHEMKPINPSLPRSVSPHGTQAAAGCPGMGMGLLALFCCCFSSCAWKPPSEYHRLCCSRNHSIPLF